MKKILSCILCFSLLASIIYTPVTATEEVVDTESVEQFCDDLNQMIDEYSDSDYVTPDFVEEKQTTVAVDNELEINYLSRLIVQSNKPIETYDAIEVVSGFFNFYILQFKNEADTNYAYEQYSNDKDIISVEYDVSYDAITLTTEETTSNTELTYEDYENGWYLEATGIDKVLEKYENENLPEVIVAVVDSGVDLNNEYLKDRIKPTGFNNAGDGDEGSEQDYRGHGTSVTSVIANCTTDNVKIANYRCINSDGGIESFSLACVAILEAVSDGVIAINCSFGCYGDFELFDKTLEYAWSMSCPVFSSSGNYGQDNQFLEGSPLNASEYIISVGACTQFNTPANSTNYGKFVDILAPGVNMPLIALNDKIKLMGGTSFSSPFMVGVYAMYYVTHLKMSFEECTRIIKNCGSGTDEKYVTDFFGSGIVNPLKLFNLDLVEEPQFNIKEGKYIGDISIELSTTDNSDIYYTTDYSYPSPTNGTLYTEPILISDDSVRIRAVAYKDGQRSNYVTQTYYAAVLGTDDMFTINNDGVITEYKGNVNYLKIPEVVNGIIVKDISSFSGFNKAKLYGVILPDTVEYLGWTVDYYDRPTTDDEQIGLFEENETLHFVVGNGIKVIGYYGMSFIPNLYEVDFPNCEEIMCSGFYESSILGAVFPKVKKVDSEAFYNIRYLRELYLPECEFIGYQAFHLAKHLRILFAPKANYLPNQEFVDETFTCNNPTATQLMLNGCDRLTRVDLPYLETIGTDSFEDTAVKDVELSNIKYIYDLPNTMSSTYSYYGSYYQPVQISLSLPSTLQYCVSATNYKNELINYVVYGTEGVRSYAESWAKENDIKFVNLSPETAIVEDIETIWDEYSYKPLLFNARGFNRTYQWYGSYDNKIGDDIAILSATKNTFTPDESNEFPYYYCKMISTDINCDGEVVSRFEVFSSLCRNKFVHIHTEEEIPAVAPTCTETGLTEGTKCSVCGETLTEQKELPANGHTPANTVEEKYITPTCTENGSKDVVVYCSVCDEEISRETVTLDATGHSYTTAVTAPTCTEQGYTTYTCSCGDNYVDDYVNATGHADNDGDGYCDKDNELLDPSVECDHACHSDNFFRSLFWKIIRFFNKLFGLNKTCECGAAHY